MVLSYQDLSDEVQKRKRVKATITTESSYGAPVIALEEGGTLDMMSWFTFGYRVEKATKKELEALKKMGLET